MPRPSWPELRGIRRTIQRDVEALCRAGIPLVTTQGQGGGISIMEGYRIDSTLLTSGDMQAILAGLRSLDSVSGTNRYGSSWKSCPRRLHADARQPEPAH